MQGIQEGFSEEEINFSLLTLIPHWDLKVEDVTSQGKKGRKSSKQTEQHVRGLETVMTIWMKSKKPNVVKAWYP